MLCCTDLVVRSPDQRGLICQELNPKLSHTHTHTLLKKSNMEWISEGRLCSYIHMESELGGEELTIFSGIVEVQSARYVRK